MKKITCSVILLLLSACNLPSGNNGLSLPKSVSIGKTYKMGFDGGYADIKVLEFDGGWTKVQTNGGETSWMNNRIIRAVIVEEGKSDSH